jgi:hypothetical protein
VQQDADDIWCYLDPSTFLIKVNIKTVSKHPVEPLGVSDCKKRQDLRFSQRYTRCYKPGYRILKQKVLLVVRKGSKQVRGTVGKAAWGPAVVRGRKRWSWLSWSPELGEARLAICFKETWWVDFSALTLDPARTLQRGKTNLRGQERAHISYQNIKGSLCTRFTTVVTIAANFRTLTCYINLRYAAGHEGGSIFFPSFSVSCHEGGSIFFPSFSVSCLFCDFWEYFGVNARNIMYYIRRGLMIDCLWRLFVRHGVNSWPRRIIR